MKFLDILKSIFRKKEANIDRSNRKAEREKTIRVLQRDSTEEAEAKKRPYSVTEASLCRTSYGICKLKEDGSKRYLLFPEKMNVRFIPFVENDCIEAVYTINPEEYIIDDNKRFAYEIIDSAQFFMLTKEQKEEISRDLKSRGISYRFPEEIDNYNQVINILKESNILSRNQDSDWFEKERFISEIREVKGSNTYKELHLIRLANGMRYLLIINQIIPNVIEYSPSFMNLYEKGAVKVSYLDGYAFIVPFGKPR